jgi:thioredoxin-like negative regulator of GroEL
MTKKILMFTSPTCAPCKLVKPEILRLQEELGFELQTFDLTTDAAEFQKRGVRTVPAVIAVDSEGAEVGRFTGALKPAHIDAKLYEWGL